MQIETLLEQKIIAIVRGVSEKDIIQTVEALKQGGIKAVEITFDQKDENKYKETLTSLKKVKEHFGEEILLGAGTVLTPKSVGQAIENGAEYIISPNVDKEVIEMTKKMGAISIPGALTPSEAVDAIKYGADIIKLFPAGTLGKAYIAALMGPLNHIKFMAVGGIDKTNIKSFLDLGIAGVGIGGNLVNSKLTSAGEFEEITKRALEFTKNI
ncbi:2-dehydro-3-deoxyphosphogluconate aldolase [Candidatus Epulonipiscium fishelsonii]|uniref:2-dehydro-3-deoxyphosphogluconate aldolase n=1 Tax=Candidatus Epulonipiscium fishelsonii TaxID=77094 RepID=A0ACC8XCX4_9FIRM|nr:2-dehydro-3-deoxyphosphogluconate aldolase [Epulopiscium sp. SCG-B11WGA-EpuloA1]ONI41784.1 2-dehydro-3-deoxyphosphogluconate aldolase [Epulopiscium sp. SCG-B05WGA-EpuloA1]